MPKNSAFRGAESAREAANAEKFGICTYEKTIFIREGPGDRSLKRRNYKQAGFFRLLSGGPARHITRYPRGAFSFLYWEGRMPVHFLKVRVKCASSK